MGFKRDYCEKVSSVGKATAIKYFKQFLVYYQNSEAIVTKSMKSYAHLCSLLNQSCIN